MNAIILAAGYGHRLRPYTLHTPKCLMPINGKPLLDIWIDKLIAAGIANILVNTHYLHEMVKNHLRKSPLFNRITIIHEPKLQGTAKTLLNNINFFKGEDGLLIHGDNYCLDSLTNLIQAHKQRPKEATLTMLTFRTDTPEECGIVEVNNLGVVSDFFEKIKNPPSNLANAAVYVLSKEFLTEVTLRDDNPVDFSRHVIPKFKNKIFTYETKKFFIDIGSPAAYAKANMINNAFNLLD